MNKKKKRRDYQKEYKKIWPMNKKKIKRLPKRIL